ncbi:hypothetical protein JXA80_04090 [bacterium]|nr:hypothetical protein [candidate division CSSED10-310 bacterium]
MIRFVLACLVACGMLGSVSVCHYMLTRSPVTEPPTSIQPTLRSESALQTPHRTPDQQADTTVSPSRIQLQNNDAARRFFLILTSGFNTAPDPFALGSDGLTEPTRLSAQYGDKSIITLLNDLLRGESIRSSEFDVADTDITRGTLTLFIRATPAETDARIPCPLRIDLIRADGFPCDTYTLWTPGNGVMLTGEATLNPVPGSNTAALGWELVK